MKYFYIFGKLRIMQFFLGLTRFSVSYAQRKIVDLVENVLLVSREYETRKSRYFYMVKMSRALRFFQVVNQLSTISTAGDIGELQNTLIYHIYLTKSVLFCCLNSLPFYF